MINFSPGGCSPLPLCPRLWTWLRSAGGESSHPVVIAIDGPSCSGKSILATAVALRSGASILAGDDFYRDTLPGLTATQREAMSDAAVVDVVIDWERLREEGLQPLRAGQSATFQPYDWDDRRRSAGTGEDRSGGEVDHCGGRIRRTPGTRRPH